MPADLWAHLDTIEATIRRSPFLYLCLDFDGTLVPIVEDPDAVKLPERRRERLEAINERSRMRVAVISGRSLDDIRDRVGVGSLTYAGNHGLEIQQPDGDWVHPAVASTRPKISAVVRDLKASFEAISGARVEDKGATVSVHVRGLDQDLTSSVEDQTYRRVENVDGIRIARGKSVLQIRPDVDWGKGRAIERLTRCIADESAVVYVGDDRTDADGFDAVNKRSGPGFSIAVGNPSLPAQYRVRDPEAVEKWLDWLYEVQPASINADVSD